MTGLLWPSVNATRNSSLTNFTNLETFYSAKLEFLQTIFTLVAAFIADSDVNRKMCKL
jgi:hypothetical protein